VTYRHDNDGLRYRVEALEEELADARRTIARLEGVRDEGAPRGVDWVTGTARSLTLERVIERELDDAVLEAIANLARSRLSAPRLTAIGKSLTIGTHDAELRVSRTETGGTSIRLTRNTVHVRAGLGALVLLGSVFVNFPLAMYTSTFFGPGMWLGSIAVCFVANLLGARALVSRGQRRVERNLVGVFEAACELVKVQGKPLARTRVVTATNAEDANVDDTLGDTVSRRAVSS
jgi:hypothetical protein